MALELIISGPDYEEIAAGFSAEEREMLVLIAREDFGGQPQQNGTLYTSTEFAAVLDLASGELSAHSGFLNFLMPDPHRFGNFVKFGIYHVRARKSAAAPEEIKLKNHYLNKYLLTAIIEDGLTDPRLEQIRMQLQTQAQQQADQLAGITPEPYYSEAFRSEIRFNVEDETVSPEFVKRCEEHLKNMPERMIEVIMEGAKKYCLFFMELCKESAGDKYDPSEFPPVTPETPAMEMEPYFGIHEAIIEIPEDESAVAYRLSGSVDWEPEHGLEICIRDDRVLYLGGFDGNSPWSDYDPDDEWNFVNGIPQD